MSQISCSKNILLHLSLISGIGPATIQKIMTVLERVGDWSMLYALNAHDLQMQCHLGSVAAQKLVIGLRDTSLLDQELQLIDKQAITVLTVMDEQYPELLKHIHLPPPILYVRGSTTILQKPSIAIIGSRQAHQYAQKAIDSIVPVLVAHGYTIVSGGALGADSMAHQATLQSHGSTVAVLGSGLLELYPASNRRLFNQIAEQGALISPFPLRMQANEGTFPARNRIIAGLCQAVVVVQAAIKSGASITANFALDQGREVAVVPGDIFDPLSAGCHRLARQGAAIVSSAADILELLGITMDMAQEAKVPSIPVASVASPPIMDNPVVRACTYPQTFDQLLVATRLSPSELQEHLFNLSLQGRIHQNMAGLWVIC